VPIPSGLVIRAGQPTDASPIAGVQVRSWQVAYRGVFPDEWLDRLTVEERLPFWERYLSDDDTATLVAEIDGIPVGFALLGADRDDPSRGKILAIYLDPEVWRRGIGRALMLASEKTLSERFSTATLWVLDQNERARRFYETVGWVHDGTSKPMVIFGRDATEVRYRKDLDPGRAEGSSTR
jgi:ribosomal protein S18 acetylase RimI-like enzyme